MSPRTWSVDAAACSSAFGGDVSEKLDYTPGTFTVGQHIRGKWVQPLRADPASARAGPGHQQGHPHGRPASPSVDGKYADHLPLYR
jgi:transposase